MAPVSNAIAVPACEEGIEDPMHPYGTVEGQNCAKWILEADDE